MDITICNYSASHMRKRVKATTKIDTGPRGIIPACQGCVDSLAAAEARIRELAAKAANRQGRR